MSTALRIRPATSPRLAAAARGISPLSADECVPCSLTAASPPPPPPPAKKTPPPAKAPGDTTPPPATPADTPAEPSDTGDPEPDPNDPAEPAEQEDPNAPKKPLSTSPKWKGVIGMEGTLTGDGRLIEKNALTWENLPIPLRYVPVDNGSHDGAQVVGQITSISRGSGGQILASGTFDMDSPIGVEAQRQVASGLTTGVSMDLDNVDFEVRIAQELLDEDAFFMPLFADAPPSDATPPGSQPDTTGGGSDPEHPVDADGRVTVMEVGADDEVRATTAARVRAATMVAIPAFAEAHIEIDDGAPAPAAAPGVPAAAPASGTPAGVAAAIANAVIYTVERLTDVPADAVCLHPGCTNAPAYSVSSDDARVNGLFCGEHATTHEGHSLVASGGPLAPPLAWFDNPRLTGPTPLRVGTDGRVYGHLAVWGTCHTTHTLQGQCIAPPRNRTGYRGFHTGSLVTASGDEIAVGRITMDTKHAGLSLSAAASAAHYDNTGSVAAYVRAGEDDYGIWIAGALRAGASDEQVQALRAAPLSGDWRQQGTDIEMVAVLAVNVPGFPVPRPQGHVSGEKVTALVASGMLPPAKVVRPGLPGALTSDDLRYLKALAARERAKEEERVAAVLRADAAKAFAARVRVSNFAAARHRHRPASTAVTRTRPTV